MQRALANNSAVYEEKPEVGVFLKEWTSLYESKSGERGIFNRQAAKKHIELLCRRDPDYDFGTNPCSEIVLRSAQTCNLSEVVIRPEDTIESLCRKVKIATIIGTIQSTLTDIKYLRSVWKKNMEEERLLGVSLISLVVLSSCFLPAQFFNCCISCSEVEMFEAIRKMTPFERWLYEWNTADDEQPIQERLADLLRRGRPVKIPAKMVYT